MSKIRRPVNNPRVTVSSSAPVPEKDISLVISLRLSHDLANRLDKYCSVVGVSKNSLVSIAISDFLAARFSE